MATRPGDINANVGIALDSQGMGGALRTLQDQIGSIIQDLNKAGAAAQKAIQQGGKAGAEAAQMFNTQLRALNQLQGSVKTLTNTNTRNLFGGFTDANNIGKIAAGMDRFFRGLENGSPSVEKLTSRLTLMNQQAAQMLSSGQNVPRNFWDKRLQVSEALSSFKKLETAQEQMMRRISGLSPEGQARLSPYVTSYQAALSQFDKLAGNTRTGPALATQLATLKTMSTELSKQVQLIEQEDRATQSLLRSTRARAEALLNATAAEREAQLRSGANRYSTLLAGRTGGGQFNDVIGSPVGNISKSGMDALAQSTRLAAQAQNQLNTAMVSNAPQQRIQQLIDRYEALLRLQQQSLAVANKENAPGFLGGIKQGFLTVARGPGGENVGGLGGIGNLVGRVAAFTTAYRAINLVTTSLQEGLGFIIQWQDQLAQLQAISGATGSEMNTLSENILHVAENSANTVQEITDAAKILAQAGYSAQETSQLLQNIVDLSAASGASPAESVDILTSAMGAFNLQVSDASHITDALVTTLNRTKLSASQVQLGLQYLGATAKENNLTFEDLVATLGAAADAGIRSGSTMATGTRQLLIDLQDPTKKLVGELKDIGLTMGDVDVKTRGFIPVLQTLHDHGFNAFQAIETRAAAMYEVLSDNLEEMQQLREETLQTNTAHEAAAKRLNSVNAQWTELKNRLAGVASDLGKTLLPLLGSLIRIFLSLGQQISPIIQRFQDLQNTLNGFATSRHAFLINQLNQVLGIFGVQLNNASSGATDLATSMDESQTHLDDATAAVQNQRSQIKSLEEETQTLIQRHDTLAKNTGAVQYEIDRLSGRFPGLREEFAKTKGGIDGLIQAMEALDTQSQNTLAQYTQSQANIASGTAQLAANQAWHTRNSLLAQYSTGREHEIISLLGTPRNAPNADVLIDKGLTLLRLFENNVNIDKSTREKFGQDAHSLISLFQTAQTTRNEVNRALAYLANSAFSRTPQGAQFRNFSLQDSAQASATLSEIEGLPLSTRRNRVGGLISQIEKHVVQLTEAIEDLSKRGDQAAVKAVQGIKTAEQNTIKRLKAAGQPTDEEQRALEHGPGAGLTMTSAQLRAALEQHFPGIVISGGFRGPNHPLYDPNSWHSNMPGGHAVDIARLPNGVTIDNVIKFLESLGQQIDLRNPNSFLNEFVHPSKHATGGHYHIGVVAQKSRASQEAEREADKAQELALRQQQLLANEHVKSLKEQVTTQSDVVSHETNISQLLTDYYALKVKNDEYVKAQYAAAVAEADRRKLTGADRQEFLTDARTKILEDAHQLYLSTLDDMGKALGDYLQNAMKIIQDRIQRNLAGLNQTLATEQGRLKGLDSPFLAGKIPDYTKVLQQRRVDSAQRNLDAATYQQNIIAISEYQKHIAEVQTEFNKIQRMDPQGATRVWQQYNNDVLQAQGNIRDLQTQVTEFAAEQQAIQLAPVNWSEATQQAVRAWQISNNSGLSLNQRMWGQLGEAIESVHGSFQQFFVDIMSGTVSVGKAFGNMAKAIVSALLEIAAKAIATQIFSLLLSFLPGAAGANLGGANSALDALGAIPVYRGGLIKSFNRPPERYAGGGYVASGIPTRDTVPALLSKGEFVMRRSAAEDIGHRLLMDMNNRGSAALEKMGKGTVVLPTGQPQETNIWVVLPEEKPIPGPNDFIAAIHNDVLRNGATKTLIKRVANGG